METYDVLVAGVPYGYQGDYSDGRWLTAENIAAIEACHPGIRLEHLPVDDLNNGAEPQHPPQAMLVETSGTLTAWEDLPAILLGSAFRRLVTPALLMVQSASAGVEQLVDIVPEGVALCNASGVHAPAIAETVLASILASAKMLYQRRIDQAKRAWLQLPCRELGGTTMCILGTGDIGAATAQLATAFGIRTIGVRRTAQPAPGFDEVVTSDRLIEAVAEADYLVIACPLTPETEGLVDATVLKAMKPGGYLANVARGAIVDEAAMIDAFQSGHLRGGFLDSHVNEPLLPDSPLWDLPGVDVSPHDSHASQLLGDHQVALFCRNLRALTSGEPLINVVDIARGY
jgi:phosphoglycerate dehydrogenase-like enzyme